MSAKAQDLIASAYERFIAEVPELAKLKLAGRVELRGRGDVQVFRVEVPGPKVTKGEPDDARVEIALARSDFNDLVDDGSLESWHQAYDRGHVKFGGDPAVLKLVGTVIERHEARGRLKKAR